MLETLVAVYERVLAALPQLIKLSLLWMGIAIIGDMLGRNAYTEIVTTGSAQPNSLAISGFILHVLGTLSGWYFAHRFMIEGNATRFMPDRMQVKFVVLQAANLFLLSLFAGSVVGLLGAVWIINASHQIEAEFLTATRTTSLFLSLPIIVLVFSRMLLLAPLLARGLPQAVQWSWRATKGHIIRLFLLQVGCLLPLVVTELLTGFLQRSGAPSLGLALVSVSGIFFSQWLYTRLAEDEYSKLVKTA